jgi:protein SCO1
VAKPSTGDYRPLLFVLAGIAAAAFFVVFLLNRNVLEPPTAPAEETQAQIGGPFTLVDQNGKARSDADFRGSLMLVYFGYTNCPDVCPLALNNMSGALDSLGEKANGVVPIFITVDPERDTADKLKQYAAQFTPRLVALTGDVKDIKAAANAYHVYFAKHQEKDGSYSMDHSSIIFLMDRDGHFLTHFPAVASAQDIAAGIAKYL